MSVVLKVKKSETALSKPTSSDIVVGEVALNAKDQRIFVRDSNGDIITVGEAGGIRHESSAVTFKVTVATKDATHRYNGSGSSSGYKIDGSFSPTLLLVPGNTYKFDQADSSNSGHPLLFYYEAAKTTAYSTGVTTSGTPGSSGAYTQIVVSDSTPMVLHYQCSSHGYMGNQIVTKTRNLTGFDTDDLSEGSTNLYFTNARADARVQAAIKDEDNFASNSATHIPSQQSVKAYVDGQTTDETAEGSTNLYYTNARVDTHLNQSSAGSGQILGWNGSDYAWVNDASGSSLTVQEEGSSLSTAATTLNFVGSGVTASGSGATKTITISGGGSSTGNTTDVTQSSHGFAAKDAIRHNGSSWVKAQADDNSTLALGIVTAVADSNNFTIAQAGRFTISSHGLTVGQWYYLSSSSAGGLTATEPAISQPIVYVESANVIFVYPYRPTNILLDGSSGVTPGDNTVTSAKIVNGTIVEADLADNAVTLAKMAGGTDGNLISYDANGDPVAVATGSAGQVLTSAGAGAPPTFATISAGAYNSWAIKTGTYTAANKDQLIANSGSAFTITLPAASVSGGNQGNTVIICNAGAGTVTVGRNSSNINSAAEDGTIAQGASAQLVYVDDTIGWFEI